MPQGQQHDTCKDETLPFRTRTCAHSCPYLYTQNSHPCIYTYQNKAVNSLCNSVIVLPLIIPHWLSSRPVHTSVQPLIMLQLRVDSSPNLWLSLIFLQSVVPAMYRTCTLTGTPSIPGCCYCVLADDHSPRGKCEEGITSKRNIPAINGALGCQLASLTHVIQFPPFLPQ